MFGPLEGALLVGYETVTVSVYRATSQVQASGFWRQAWTGGAPVLSAVKAWIGAARESRRLQQFGREETATLVCVVDVSVDLRIDDGVVVESGASHDVGRRFKVTTSRTPGGRYRRCELEEIARESFPA